MVEQVNGRSPQVEVAETMHVSSVGSLVTTAMVSFFDIYVLSLVTDTDYIFLRQKPAQILEAPRSPRLGLAQEEANEAEVGDGDGQVEGSLGESPQNRPARCSALLMTLCETVVSSVPLSVLWRRSRSFSVCCPLLFPLYFTHGFVVHYNVAGFRCNLDVTFLGEWVVLEIGFPAMDMHPVSLCGKLN